MMNSLHALISFAQIQAIKGSGAAGGAPATAGEAAPVGGPPASGGMETLIMIGAMFLIFYFLLIRPQQKRQKEHTKFVDALRKGDQVITQGGIYGRVAEIDGAVATVEIAKNTHIKILKSQLACLQHEDNAGGSNKDNEAIQSAQQR